MTEMVLHVWGTRMKLMPGMDNVNWTERIGTVTVRCHSWPLIDLFTSWRRVPLLVTGVNMAKNKNGKKRLTFVTPLEAKQVRYNLESQFAERKIVGAWKNKPSLVLVWKFPPITNTHRLRSSHYVILFTYQCRAWDNLFHFYATKLALPIVHWWRVKTCS